MTRINCGVAVEQLTDEHLLAEHRELKRLPSVDDKEDVSDAEELTRDLMALLASFSGKYYGKRSLDRRKNKN